MMCRRKFYVALAVFLISRLSLANEGQCGKGTITARVLYNGAINFSNPIVRACDLNKGRCYHQLGASNQFMELAADPVLSTGEANKLIGYTLRLGLHPTMATNLSTSALTLASKGRLFLGGQKMNGVEWPSVLVESNITICP